MPGTAQEKLKTQEIKTPAEIAAELEKKAVLLEMDGKQGDATRKRELAKKVLAVESDTVTGTTELKLEALQSKLPTLEKKDLEEARTISSAEMAIGAAGLTVAAVAINKKLDDSGLGKLGIKDGIKEWLTEELAEEPDKDAGFFDKIIHKIKMMFLLPFAKIFGVDLTKKGEKKDYKDDGKKERNEEKKEGEVPKNLRLESEKLTLKNSAYNHMADHIFLRRNHLVFKGWWQAVGSGIADGTWKKDERKNKEELNKTAEGILHSDFVRGKTFNQLKIYKGHPEKMDIANISNPQQQHAADLAMQTLFHPDNESWVDENLKGRLPDWRNLPLHESIYALYGEIGYEGIERLKNGLQGVNWQNPGDIAGRMKNMMVQKKGDGTYGGIVGENLEFLRSQGLDNEVITRALDTDGNISVRDFREKTVKDSKYINPDAQKFMTDLVKEGGFAQKITGVLEKFGFGDYTKDFNNGDTFNMRQLLMLYAITKGGTDLESMKKGTRAELYMTIFGIILEKNPVAMPGKKLIEFANSPTNKYIAEIGEFVGMQIDRATYEGMLVTMGFGADTLKLMNDIREKNPSIFYGVLTAIALAFVAAYYLRVPMLTATIAWGIITAGATAAGVSIIGGIGK